MTRSMALRSARRAAVPMLAALLAVGVSAPAQACSRGTFSGPLVDLQPATHQALDGARATLTLTSRGGRTAARLRVRGIEPAAAGVRYAAHLHVGPCRAGDGAAAGGHYNQNVIDGVTPVVVGPHTELWLDFTVRGGGRAYAGTTVPFVPRPGERSIVVHALDPDGTAGTRLACLPVVWS